MIALFEKLIGKNPLRPAVTPYFRFQEWVGALLLIAGMGGLAFFYMNALIPVEDQFAALVRDERKLQLDIDSLTAEKVQKEQEAKRVGAALGNLERFNQRRLRDIETGQLALINEINDLARKSGLQIPGEVTIDPQTRDTLFESKKRSGRGGDRSGDESPVFPALDVQFSLFGPYGNQRKFIKALEHSKQYLILNLVGLESQSEQRRGGQSSEGVSVEYELTAYFRQK